jgi:putative sporulation integral membrane protein ytvI
MKGRKYKMNKEFTKNTLNIIIPIFCFTVVILFLPILIKFSFPFLIGFLMSLIIKPIVDKIEKIPFLKKTHASIFILLIFFVILFILGYLGFSLLYDKSYLFLKDLPEQYQNLKLKLDIFIKEHNDFIVHLPSNIRTNVLNFSTNLDKEIANLSQKLIKPTLTLSIDLLTSFPSILINVLFIIFSTYQFSVNSDKYIEWIKKKFSNEKIDNFIKLKNESINIFKKWLLAQFKIMFFVWLVIFIGLTVIKSKNAFWMASLIAFLDFLPAFGVGFIMFPWILISLLNGNFYFTFGLIIIYILTQITRNFLQPIFCGVEFGLNALTTMIAIFIGFQLKGLVGMIFAIPIYTMIVFLYRNHFFDNFTNSLKYFYNRIEEFRK